MELSALDPGKQGLKHSRALWYWLKGALSALDPGKQGLKRIGVQIRPDFDFAFSA